MKPVKVGLLGMGTVGSGTINVRGVDKAFVRQVRDRGWTKESPGRLE